MHWTSQQCKTYQYTNLLSLQWAASILLKRAKWTHIWLHIAKYPPPLQKGYENLLMHYHYVTVFYSWVRILTFIWKKTLHFLSSRTYCAKLNKIKIWNVRPTDRRRSNSPSEKLRWVTHQSKKPPKTPQ